jgi:hypothetical protein
MVGMEVSELVVLACVLVLVLWSGCVLFVKGWLFCPAVEKMFGFARLDEG